MGPRQTPKSTSCVVRLYATFHFVAIHEVVSVHKIQTGKRYTKEFHSASVAKGLLRTNEGCIPASKGWRRPGMKAHGVSSCFNEPVFQFRSPASESKRRGQNTEAPRAVPACPRWAGWGAAGAPPAPAPGDVGARGWAEVRAPRLPEAGTFL